MATTGRNTDCIPARIELIANAIRKGATYRIAALKAGISERTLHLWRSRGAEGDEPYATLVDAIHAAEAEHAEALLAVIDEVATGEGDARVKMDAAKFMLERRYLRDYGKTVQEIDLGDAGVTVLRVDLPEGAGMSRSDDDRRELLRRSDG